MQKERHRGGKRKRERERERVREKEREREREREESACMLRTKNCFIPSPNRLFISFPPLTLSLSLSLSYPLCVSLSLSLSYPLCVSLPLPPSLSLFLYVFCIQAAFIVQTITACPFSTTRWPITFFRTK
jgi:hypothetical protein